ncbi:tetratricopeptide repeat protein [bacterium]|nr:tetratricopeptide repeat protein [bacterium]
MEENRYIELTKKIVDLNPDKSLSDRLDILTLENFQESEYDDIIEYLKKEAYSNVDNSIIYNNIGIFYYKQKKYEEAATYYKKVVELEPENAIYYNNLGITYENQKKYEEAEKYYKKAIELEPNTAKYHNNLGITYKKQEKYKEAEFYYKKAIELEPNMATYHYNLGNAYGWHGKYGEAEKYLKKAIELESISIENYFGLLYSYLKKERYEYAEFYFKKALESKNKNLFYYCNLGDIYYGQENYEQAGFCYNSIDKIYNDYLEMIFFQLEKYEQAEFYLKKVIILEPNNDYFYKLLSELYQKSKKYEDFNLTFEKYYNNENINPKSKSLTIGYLISLTLILDDIYKSNNLEKNNIEDIKNKIKNVLLMQNLKKTQSNENEKLNLEIDKDENDSNTKKMYNKIENDFFKNSFWSEIGIYTIIEVFSLFSDQIRFINLYKDVAKLIDEDKINEILTIPVNSSEDSNETKHPLSFLKLINSKGKEISIVKIKKIDIFRDILKTNDSNEIKKIKIKLSLLEVVKEDIETKLDIKIKGKSQNQNYRLLMNLSNLYIIITKQLQEEVTELTKKHEQEKRILQQNIMQAVSHTLSNMIFVQKAITKNLLGSSNIEEKIKKLQLFQSLTSSVIDSIKVAFGDNVENNIDFFKSISKNRLSVFTILYFGLNINLDNLLQAAGYWENIYRDFFKITSKNEEEIIDLTDEIRKNRDFNISELSENSVKNFSLFLKSDSNRVVMNNFLIDIDVLKNIYIEQESYTFSIIFTILQELIKNMLKYGSIDSEEPFIIKAIEFDDSYKITFKNRIKTQETNKIGTLKGLEMIKLFSEILGGFEKKIEENRFEITITIKKDFISED